MAHPRISKLKTPAEFLAHLESLGVSLPFDEQIETGDSAALAQSLSFGSGGGQESIGNRFCILPMEGWDATKDGHPTDLVRRRWTNFGLSGARLMWGCEAVAVRHDGRANPNQLLLNTETVGELAKLRELLVSTHEKQFGDVSDLSVGLQLTHSGRFARPNDKATLEPRTVYPHPVLDEQFGVDPKTAILSDDDLKTLIDDFVAAAVLAEQAGFSWIDVKHCHG